MKEKRWELFWKGMIVGGTMIVPGVSGGTMAMILGVYDNIILAVSTWRRAPLRNSLTLLLFTTGAGVGLFCFVTPLSWFLEKYPVPVVYFFVGAVLGAVPFIARKSGTEELSWTAAIYMITGVVVVFAISSLPTGFVVMQENYLSLLFVGVIAAIALILPGISISHLFLILGMYENILHAVRQLEWGYLLPLGLGVMVGTVLFCKVLEQAMDQFPNQTYLMILGFLIGSVAQIFPGVPNQNQFFVSVILFFTGFVLLYRLGKL